TDASHRVVARRELLHVLVHARVDAPLAQLRAHIHTLNPPHIAVAPIAPFVRNEQRRRDATVDFGNEIPSVRRLIEYCLDSATAHLAIEIHIFCLARHRDLKVEDVTGVSARRISIANLHPLSSPASWCP